MIFKHLEFENSPGSGPRIKGHIDREIQFPEGKMLVGGQNVVLPADPVTIAYDPWIQFPKQEWDESVAEVFEEMVRLWNEKHSIAE